MSSPPPSATKPNYHDLEVARANGYPGPHRAADLPAFVLTIKAMAGAMFDPELGGLLAHHSSGEQSFSTRPLVAGDEVVVKASWRASPSPVATSSW